MRYSWTWLLVFMLAALWGCSTTQMGSDESERTYRDIADIKASDNAVVNLTLTMPISKEEERTTEGSATSDNKLETFLTAAMDAAQALGGKDGVNFLDDIQNIVEKWIHDEDVSVEPGGSGGDVDPVPVPDPGTSDGDGDDGDPTGNLDPNWDNYDIAAEADCIKDGITFRDSEETVGVPQNLCQFDRPGYEYGDSFTVLWTSGEWLKVPNSGSMAWLPKNEDGEKDYRKYQPQEPIEGGGFVEGTPAEVYAPRGDKSTKAYILIEKDNPDVAGYKFFKEYPWSGKYPDPAHHRGWWS